MPCGALGVWLLWSLLSIHTTAYVTQTLFWTPSHVWLVFRGGAGDGGLRQEGVGVPDLHGGDDAPRQDLAMQGSLFNLPPIDIVCYFSRQIWYETICCTLWYCWMIVRCNLKSYESQGNPVRSYELLRNNHGMLCGPHDVLGYDCLLLDDNTM